jgi:ABC-type uncharacterized transport system substrate-binding protein
MSDQHSVDTERTEVKKTMGMRTVILLWLLITVLLITAPSAAAQQPEKIFRIGFLDPSTASSMGGLLEVFRQELRKLGWIEGKNLIFEYRLAEQKPERLPELAAELVRLKVDLIVTSGGPSALAAKGATSTVPIVMANVGDPLALVWLPVWGDRAAILRDLRVYRPS